MFILCLRKMLDGTYSTGRQRELFDIQIFPVYRHNQKLSSKHVLASHQLSKQEIYFTREFFKILNDYKKTSSWAGFFFKYTLYAKCPMGIMTTVNTIHAEQLLEKSSILQSYFLEHIY